MVVGELVRPVVTPLSKTHLRGFTSYLLHSRAHIRSASPQIVFGSFVRMSQSFSQPVTSYPGPRKERHICVLCRLQIAELFARVLGLCKLTLKGGG